jgi:hypothetical protein
MKFVPDREQILEVSPVYKSRRKHMPDGVILLLSNMRWSGSVSSELESGNRASASLAWKGITDAPASYTEFICHLGNCAPYDSKGSLRPFAKNDTVW